MNIVKHLEEFPQDNLVETIENVFDFDVYDSQLREHLSEVFQKHGIPLGNLGE